MKKFIVMLLSLLLIAMCLTACGEKEETSSSKKKDKVESTVEDEATPAPTEAATAEPTEAPTPKPTEAPTPTSGPTATPEPEATEAPVGEHTYVIELTEVGLRKIDVVKLYSDYADIAIDTAALNADVVPFVILETADESLAMTCKKDFEDLGATMKLYMDGEEVIIDVTEEEKESYCVYLKDVGAEKVKVIKVVRDSFGYGLSVATDLVDAAPVVVFVTEDAEFAEEVLVELTRAGAEASVEQFEGLAVGERPEEDVVVEEPNVEEGNNTENEDPAEEVNEDGHYIVLEDVGSEKVKVIKVLRETLGIGLEEAKNLADNAPIEIYMTEEWDEANSICKALDEVGAIVNIYDYQQITEMRENMESEEPTDDEEESEIIMEYSVSDVFYITGRGCALTGQVVKGTVRVGDSIIVIMEDGTEIPAVVSELESFRQLYEEASEGSNVGIFIKEADRKTMEPAVKIIIRAE